MDRQTRRNIKHDKFVDDVATVASLAQENVRTVLIALAVIVIAGGGAIGWFVMKRAGEQKAQSRLAEGITILESPLPNAPGADPSTVRYQTEAERAAAAEAAFAAVAGEHGGTDAADVAGLFLARLETSRGQYGEAEKRFAAFIEEHPEHVLADGARIALYQLRIARGAVAGVITDLEGELAKPDRALPADILLSLLANAYEVTGDASKARSTWQRIVNEFPDSPYGIDAQRRLFQG